ncbi:REP-associated tyrosine transposase [Botrimarina hoheduenensis]|uniref:Transposase IS200 like protein n=1 Tax=Botrimarina hoheduenensis TaxID=2528000 RepID=A0A5C5WCC0_9BACT|nr:transposase [Botrimarina hoheduenensis]TWT47681.1 Transposase IS200 like protein [Botrimarina hoheduenensis]
MPPPHRKRVRHFDATPEPHELTFSCYRRLPLLEHDGRLRLLAQSLDAATDRNGWRLAAFVFMPEHVHLLVFPVTPTARVSRLLFSIKRPFSFRIKRCLAAEKNPLVEQLTVRQRPGVDAFRFWQEGPGYDRNLRSQRALAAAIDYVHANPVRRGLVASATDWKWSSVRWYATDARLEEPDLPRLTPLPADCWPGRGDFSG